MIDKETFEQNSLSSLKKVSNLQCAV